MSEQHRTWVYAVVPQAVPVALEEIAGVAGEPVRLVTDANIGAVVGSLPAQDADEEPLRRHLADPDWLEQAARGHHGVVSACFASVPTVPFRLATIYRDDQRVADMLAQRRDELRTALATVARRAEWGVQAFAALPAPSADEPVAATGDTPQPGTAYLLRRRAQQSAAEAARRAGAEAAENLHGALEQLAAAANRQAPTGRTVGERQAPDGQMILNAAYLVDDHRRDAFTDAARDLGERHPELRLRMTGPWPAYSFVEIGTEVPA